MTTTSEHDARIRELNADDAWRYETPGVATYSVPKMPPVRTLRYTHSRHATARRKYPPLRSLLAWVPRPNKNKKEN
jgi:hypothetical protein|nr:MAG TPA: hypothetical protein [Caudoviricetes sp.]